MMGSMGNETRRCPYHQGPRVLRAPRAAGTKFSFWKVLGAWPLPADCLQEGGRGGGKEGGCPTQVCSRASCSPGWVWRGQWASAVIRAPQPLTSVDHTQCPKVNVACARPAVMWGLWELGPGLWDPTLSPGVVSTGLGTGQGTWSLSAQHGAEVTPSLQQGSWRERSGGACDLGPEPSASVGWKAGRSRVRGTRQEGSGRLCPPGSRGSGLPS